MRFAGNCSIYRIHPLPLVLAALPLALAACGETESPAAATAQESVVSAGTHRQYGVPQRIGNGTVRTYVVSDEKSGRTPLEVGIALSETALEGLPAPMPGHDHGSMMLIDMPVRNPTPYEFVQFNWNPAGHDPAGVYDMPHFDFHFYRVPVAVMESIVPSDPQYDVKAATLPAQQYRAPFYVDAGTAAGVPQGAASVPLMGLHWFDVRSPELQQIIGNPDAWRPFTKTFLIGSWAGEFIFEEPMITRAYLLDARAQNRDELIPLPVPAQYGRPGFYPTAYRIAWDAQAKEYRVALTQFVWSAS